MKVMPTGFDARAAMVWAGLAQAAASPAPGPTEAVVPLGLVYEIVVRAERPDEAEISLELPAAPAALSAARDGDGAALLDVRCGDGRAAARANGGWSVPPGCRHFVWRVALADIDAAGLDASLPAAAYSLRHGYWLIPERGGLLRADDHGGAALVRLELDDGRTVERRYAFPSNSQPPFYAVVGLAPTQELAGGGFTLRVFGEVPDYPWMRDIHGHVLASWSRWRRDLVSGPAPDRIDWVWIQPSEELEPGYNASAGAEAIFSQIRLREGDPDAEAKARVVIATSAAHEGFHTITGAAGQAWPAWVNESLASHFAIAAARTFLSAEDRIWLDAFFVAPQVRAPLLEAQARYGAGDGAQAQVFYTWGARFWGEVEAVLTNASNGSGRLAALIRATGNFGGTDLNDAAALAALLDRHSGGRAGAIVRCYLQGEGCPD